MSMTHHGDVYEDTAGKWTDADYIARSENTNVLCQQTFLRF